MNGKINMFLCLLICVSVLFSCAMPEKTEPEPAPVTPDYEKVPFVSGQKIPKFKDETKTKSLIGTYRFLANDDVFFEYWLSLYPNGSAKAVRQGSTLKSTIEYSGSWSNYGDSFSLTLNGLVKRDAVTLDWSKWDEDNLIEYKANSFYNELLYKVSDKTMNTSIFTDQSRIVGLWAASDDYGEVIGLRILPDNTAWEYSTTNSVDGKGSKRKWSILEITPEIIFYNINYPSINEHLSIVTVGDFLLLGATPYAKIE